MTLVPGSPVAAWQWVDVALLAVLIPTTTYLLYRHWRLHGSFGRTISHTVAHDVFSRRVFTAVMLVCFPLYYAAIWLWLAPRQGMPPVFYYLMLVCAASELLFVLFPTTDEHEKKHTVFAGFVMLSLPVFAAPILGYGITVSAATAWSCWAFIIASAGIALLWVLGRLKRGGLFAAECVYCVLFWLMIFCAGHM